MGNLRIPVDDHLKSQYIVGTHAFRFVATDDDLDAYQNRLVNWHYQDSTAELSYVTNGALRIRVLQSERIVRVGQGFVVPPGCLHTVMPVQGEASAYRTLLFDTQLIAGDASSQINYHYIRPLSGPEGAQLILLDPMHPWAKEALDHARNAVAHADAKAFGYELHVVSALCQIWCLLASHAMPSIKPQASPSGAEQERASTLITFIKQHHQEKITLEEIAHLGNISRGECCRFFKRMTQMTPFEYLTQYRIQQSLSLIEEGDLSIATISERCGFSSISYFTSTFRRHIGMPPREYRKTVQANR